MDLRTLAVDAYVGVKLRQTQLHLGHLLNAFAQYKMTKYLIWCHNITHTFHIRTANLLTFKTPDRFLQGQFPAEQLPHTPSRNDIMLRYEFVTTEGATILSFNSTGIKFLRLLHNALCKALSS